MVDAFSIDTAHKETVGSQSNSASEDHFVGMFGDREAVDPPLDEEELQEDDEERVHHADSEDYGVGILHGRLHDGGKTVAGGDPLGEGGLTQRRSDPRMSAVAEKIMLLTLMAPMLYASVMVSYLL